MNNPKARSTSIVAEKLAAETILYDKASHRAHSLNQTVALVWESANGSNSVDDIAGILHRQLGIPADRDLVLLALQELAASELLQEAVPAEVGPELLTRREVARKFALTGASVAMLPVIATVLAPTPAMASSGVAPQTISKSEATNDMNYGNIKVQTDPAYYSNTQNAKTAKTDLEAAQAAYNKGNYNAEIQDLDGALEALGLPPL